MVAPSRGTDTPSIRLNRAVFEQLCAERNATTEDQRAALVGVDRGTIRRWIKGDVSPLLTAARHTAKRLGTTVDELWKDDPQ